MASSQSDATSNSAALRPEESKLLNALQARPGVRVSIPELVQELGLDQSVLTAAAVNLAQKGLVEVSEESYRELTRGPAWEEVLPERRALEALARVGERVPLAQLPALLGKVDVRSEVKYLLRRGWFQRDADELRITPEGKRALRGEMGADELLIRELKSSPVIKVTELNKKFPGVDVEAALNLLKGREALVRFKQRTVRRVLLTSRGLQCIAPGRTETKQVVNQLTPELLTTGRWRDVTFRPYDVTLPTRPRYPGKEHPLERIKQEARRAFLEMGFQEVDSPVVELAFWDFDALFQPQDHPAREMQDTFYLARPARGRLPEEEIVGRVAAVHESGADTGSRGWRYRWSSTEAERLLLRTHTTAATIRALAADPRPPRRVFCIGKVFRRENIDPTHLPEFTQLDGIVIDDEASLVTLFGTLAEFYRRMGAKDVRFRPSYFPYTEPSVEVFANLGGLGWVEMGGAGVFRPEVVMPLGCRSRVLAWGLGLERLAMLRFGVSDIRRLYWAELSWLREAKLCR